MKIQLLLFLVSCPLLVHCGIRKSPLPPILKECMTTRISEDPTVSDEEITTSCLLEFMWLKGQKCDKASPETVDWLSSLVEKHVKVTSNPDVDIRASSSMSAKRVPATARGVNRLSVDNLATDLPPMREEYRTLSDTERHEYHDAINGMKNDKSVFPNKYDALVRYHQGASLAAHGGPAFVAWHRFYLVLYELALQEQNPNVMLPYWDSSLDLEMTDPTDSVIWTSEFLGNGRGDIDSGPFAGWSYDGRNLSRSIDSFGRLISKTKIDKLVRTRRPQSYFVRALEQQHNGVHVWVGGNMQSIFRSPSDPVFYMHHAYIDCIWEEYRKRQIRRGNDPTIYPPVRRSQRPHHNRNRLMELPSLFNKTMRNKDGYLNFWTEEFYRCAPRRWCSNRKPDCGSKWLQCDLFAKRCVSKGSIAIHSKITPAKVLEIAEQVAPEPMQSVATTHRNIVASALPKLIETQPDLVINAERTISTDDFFSLLDNTTKPVMMSRNTLLKPALTPDKSHKHLLSSMSTVASKSIDDFKLPDTQKTCSGFPTQNTFSLDCETSSDLWVFVPVKVVHLRRGDIIYDAHPVNSLGQIVKHMDVFSLGNPLPFFSNSSSQSFSKDKKCNIDSSGLAKIKIVSYGLNYDGFYEDDVFIDNRQSVSSSISYIAVKKPDAEGSNLFVSAVDECGIACQPMIIKKPRRFGFPVYRKFSGSAWITADQPVYHSNTYRGAESLVWKNQDVPYEDNNQIPIVFYCS